MSNWRYKSCPHCGGDLLMEEPGEWSCLQCGYIKYDTLISLSLILGIEVDRRPRLPAWRKYNKGGKVGRPGK